MPAKYASHPLADIFPPMTKAELAALAEDIKANGLQLPIVRSIDEFFEDTCQRQSLIDS